MRSHRGRAGSLACSSRCLDLSSASRSGVRPFWKNGLSVRGGPFGAVAVDEQRLLARQGRDHRDVLLLQRGDEIVGNVLVAHVVDEDVDALVDHPPRVGELDDMRHPDLVVLLRLIHHRGGELRRELGIAAALGVDPHLHEVGALADDLVDLGARLLWRLALRAGFERLRHEAVHHGEDARAAQVAGLLPLLELLHVVLVEIHAGRRGHAVERVLPQLRIARRRPDVAVAVDDAGRDELSGEIDHLRLPGRCCRADGP